MSLQSLSFLFQSSRLLMQALCCEDIKGAGHLELHIFSLDSSILLGNTLENGLPVAVLLLPSRLSQADSSSLQ